jgi:CheY-like chemotaxis protein
VILGEIGPLGSALMNLCVNAVDAMPGGGTLTIRTRRLPGALVELAVEDTGEGMAPEVLKMAMEPFFTTKPQGKGTGLGLATAFNTVRAHGGVLTLHSAEGQGTRVLMRLPCIVTGATSADIPDALPAPRSLNILLVDDDELLRASVPSLLGMLGHRVEAVDGGRSAMDRLIGGGLWDLVILDMNMPEMSGLETLRQIRALWPRLPVLLATGFLGSDGEAAVAADPYTFAITKPFSLDEIQQKLAHMAA